MTCIFFCDGLSSYSNLYLHDYELEHEGQLSDVSWRQVKHKRSIPHSTRPSLSFSAADHNSLMMQVDHHLIFCKQML